MRRFLFALGCALTLATAAQAAPFSKADASHDGMVTYAEARVVMPQLTETSFNKFARNGVITKSQWPSLSNFYDLMYRQR